MEQQTNQQPEIEDNILASKPQPQPQQQPVVQQQTAKPLDPLSMMASQQKLQQSQVQQQQQQTQNPDQASGKIDIFKEQQAYNQQYKNFKEVKGLDNTAPNQPKQQNSAQPTRQAGGTNIFTKSHNPDLKHLDEYGEKLESGFDVKEGNRSVIGRLVLTNFKIKFVGNGIKEPQDKLNNFYQVPYGFIQKIKPVQDLKHFVLEVTTKDQRVLRFKFEDNNLCRKATDDIRNNIEVFHVQLFCHRVLDKIRIDTRQTQQEGAEKQPIQIKLTSQDNLRKVVMNEYKRQGAHMFPTRFKRFAPDQATMHRRDIYQPQTIYVSAQLLDEQFYQAASARRNGRFPTLSYLFSNNKAAIWRCSELQQKLALTGERCTDDEDYLKEIAKIDPEKPVEKKLYIFSARAPSDKQYGSEDIRWYQQTNRTSFNFEHHKLTAAFQAIWKLAIENGQSDKTDMSFLGKLIKTKWISQVENILNYAFKAANILTHHSANLLIYCPQGSDGSSLLSSLAQVIIDHYYRTFEGFKILIQKEWVYYKHNFARKLLLVKPDKKNETSGSTNTSTTGAMNYNYGASTQAQQQTEIKQEVEPLFILFLDAVAQLVRQNPISFEFTSAYLAFLGAQLFTGKYFEFVQQPVSYSKRKITTAQPSNNSNPNGNVTQPQAPEEQAFQSVFDDQKLIKLCQTVYKNKIFMDDASVANIESENDKVDNNKQKFKLLEYDFRNLTYWAEYFDRFNLNSVQQMKLEQEQNDKFGRASVLAEVREQNGALIEKIISNLEKFDQLRNSKAEFVLKQQDLTVYNQLIETLEQITNNNCYQPQNQRLSSITKTSNKENGVQNDTTKPTAVDPQIVESVMEQPQQLQTVNEETNQKLEEQQPTVE